MCVECAALQGARLLFDRSLLAGICPPTESFESQRRSSESGVKTILGKPPPPPQMCGEKKSKKKKMRERCIFHKNFSGLYSERQPLPLDPQSEWGKTNKTLKNKHNTTGRAADERGRQTHERLTDVQSSHHRSVCIREYLKSVGSWIIIKYNCNLPTCDIPSLTTR